MALQHCLTLHQLGTSMSDHFSPICYESLYHMSQPINHQRCGLLDKADGPALGKHSALEVSKHCVCTSAGCFLRRSTLGSQRKGRLLVAPRQVCQTLLRKLNHLDGICFT